VYLYSSKLNQALAERGTSSVYNKFEVQNHDKTELAKSEYTEAEIRSTTCPIPFIFAKIHKGNSIIIIHKVNLVTRNVLAFSFQAKGIVK
jgi:hypothetical protein